MNASVVEPSPHLESENQQPTAVAEAATAVVVEDLQESGPGPTEAADAEAASASDTTAPALALSPGEREKRAESIRQLPTLPPALRESLARVVAASADSGADGKARVPIDDAIRAVEEAVPDFLRQGGNRPALSQHPGGESFFNDSPDDLSDAQAEELARRQLARSGLLRGQRARVAVD